MFCSGDAETVLICLQTWQTLVNIATLIVAAIGIGYGISQLREATKARNLTAYIEILNLWRSDDEWRKFLYRLSGTPGTLTQSDQQRLEAGLRNLNYIAIYAKNKYYPADEFVKSNWYALLKVWYKAEPFLLFERTRKGSAWLIELNDLSKRAQDYKAKHFPHEEIRIYPDALE